MREIVVGMDGSETARAAFREAVREAEWREGGVSALHVVAYPMSMGLEYGAMIDLELLREAGEDLMAKELEELEAEYDGGFPAPVESKVVFGHAGAEIIKAAGSDGKSAAELVVLGSRGLGGFKGLLLGSVTTYLVHHLPSLLLIVPAAETD